MMGFQLRSNIALFLLVLFVAVDPMYAQSPYRVFAAVKRQGTIPPDEMGVNAGLYVRSDDSTWQKFLPGNTVATGFACYEKGATRRYYLAAGNGVYRSTNNGASWKILTSWTTEQILAVLPDRDDSTVIYAATPLGIFKSVDDGANWLRKMNGFARWYVRTLVADRQNHRTLIAASEDDAYLSWDAGERWLPMRTGAHDIVSIAQHPSQASLLFVGTEQQGLRYSSDGGAHWVSCDTLRNAAIYALQWSDDGNELYAGGHRTGLWRSGDRGRHWTRIWSDESIEAILCVCVVPGHPEHVLIGTSDNGIFESTDHGTTWHPGGLPKAEVRDIKVCQ